jgi:hypothetical protein
MINEKLEKASIVHLMIALSPQRSFSAVGQSPNSRERYHTCLFHPCSKDMMLEEVTTELQVKRMTRRSFLRLQQRERLEKEHDDDKQ